MSQQPPDPEDGRDGPGETSDGGLPPPYQPPSYQPPPYQPGAYQPAPYQPAPYPQQAGSGSKVAASLGGFFTGVAWLFVVPAVTVGIGSSLWPDLVAPGLAFTGLVTLGGPIALLIPAVTRRFGAFMLIGMAVTLIVLAGVCVAFIALLSASQTG